MYKPISIDKGQLNRPKSIESLHAYLMQLYKEYEGTQFEFCEVILGECLQDITYLEDLEEKLKNQPQSDSVFSSRDRHQTVKENLESIKDIILTIRNNIIIEFEKLIYSDKLKKWYEIAGSYGYSGKGYTDENGNEKILSIFPGKENKEDIYLYNLERLEYTYDALNPYFNDPHNNGTIKPLKMLMDDFLYKVESMALPSKERFTGLEIEKCIKSQKTDFYISQWNLYGILDLKKITVVIDPVHYIMVYSTEKYLEFLMGYKENGYCIKLEKENLSLSKIYDEGLKPIQVQPSKTSEKLSHREIAFICQYEDIYLDKNLAIEKLKKFDLPISPTSGKQLIDDYNKFNTPSQRTAENVRTVNVIRKILPLLSEKAKLLAESELQIAINKQSKKREE